jgi:hypothetical protein
MSPRCPESSAVYEPCLKSVPSKLIFALLGGECNDSITMSAPFLRALWLVCASKVYSGLGADIVMESLHLLTCTPRLLKPHDEGQKEPQMVGSIVARKPGRGRQKQRRRERCPKVNSRMVCGRRKLPMRYVRLLLAYCAGLACFACSSYGQSQPTEPEKPVETTVCQLVAHCKRFDGRRLPGQRQRTLLP